MLPRGRRSGKDTLDVFFVELLRGSYIDRERWMMSTLGNEVICTCLAILRLGASAISGSSIFGGGISGSS